MRKMKIRSASVFDDLKQIAQKTKYEVFGENELEEELSLALNEGAAEEIKLSCDSRRGLITGLVELDIKPESGIEKEFGVLISVLNDSVAAGSFDYNENKTYYRITASVTEKAVSEELVGSLISRAVCEVNGNYMILKKSAEGEGFSDSVIPECAEKTEAAPTDIDKFDSMKAVLDRLGWRYKCFDDELRLSFDVLGEDIPMHFDFYVDPAEKLIVMRSPLPFEVEDDSMFNTAFAAAAVSSTLYDGCFCYSLYERRIAFKMTMSYFEGEIDEKAVMYMVSCSISTVEVFNDKLLELNRGNFSLESFLKNMYGF